MQIHPRAVDLTAFPEAHRKLFEQQSETLKREQSNIEELRAQVELLTDANRRMEHLVSELRRFIYGKKSEKLGIDARQLAFEDLEGAVATVEQATPANAPSTPAAPRRPAARSSTLARVWTCTAPRSPAGWARHPFI